MRHRLVLSQASDALGIRGRASGLPETASADDHLRRARELAPSDERAAAVELVAALRAEPRAVAGWNNLGVLARRAGDWALARRCFDLALQIDPADGLAHFNFASTLERQGEHRKADAELVRAVALDPSLWSPSVNPDIVGHPRATIALHEYFMQQRERGSLLLDPSPAPAP